MHQNAVCGAFLHLLRLKAGYIAYIVLPVGRLYSPAGSLCTKVLPEALPAGHKVVLSIIKGWSEKFKGVKGYFILDKGLGFSPSNGMFPSWGVFSAYFGKYLLKIPDVLLNSAYFYL